MYFSEFNWSLSNFREQTDIILKVMSPWAVKILAPGKGNFWQWLALYCAGAHS